MCLWGPRTSSSPGEALSPGPPAGCSLCSRAASSPTGLRWVRPSSCSYSTHRVLSASLAAGDPGRAQASAAEPTARGGGQGGGGRGQGKSGSPLTQQHSGSARHSGHWTRPPPAGRPTSRVAQAHAPAGLRLRLGTCTSRLLAFLVERGPSDTATVTVPSPSPRLGAATRGAGTGICTVTGGLGTLQRPFPWIGREGITSWALGTHSFLSNTEELGHIPNDVAEAVVHLDVGAHPGGQLGPGVRMGEPGRGWLSAWELHPPHSPQPTAHSPGPDVLREGPVPSWCPRRCGAGVLCEPRRATPMVTEEDGPVVMAMPNYPPDGLVHSPGRLLSVPLVPREDLLGGRAWSRGLHPFLPNPTQACGLSPGLQAHHGPSTRLGTAS